MPRPFYAAFLPLLCLLACSQDPEITSVAPPNEWIVVGNDLGLRNEFVDMTNVVVTNDSSISVYSAANPLMEIHFPLVDSVVIGAEEEAYHWPMQQVGRDSLVLLDTAKGNKYYLQRLRRAEFTTSVADFLRSGELKRGGGMFWSYFVFSGDAGGQSCYASRGYFRQRDWSKAVTAAKEGKPIANPIPEFIGPPLRQVSSNGFWRVEERFAQPIFVYTNGTDKLHLLVVDSLQPNSAIFGKSLNNYTPNRVSSASQFLRDSSQKVAPTLKELLPDLAATGGTATAFAAAAKEKEKEKSSILSRRFSFNGKELREGLVVPDLDLPDLQLDFPGPARYRLHTPERTVAEGTYVLHEQAPYLVVDDGCESENYWPYTHTDSTLEVKVYLKVQLTQMKLSERDLTHNPDGQHYAVDEWVATFSLP